MGKRKRVSEQADQNAENNVKRIKLENESSEIGGKGMQNESAKTSFHNSVLKMRMKNYAGMSYRQAKRIMAANENCGLVEVVDNRHVTIGWHQFGQALNAINFIVKSSLGQYKNSLDGVLLAFGKIAVVDRPLCIADQPCMHIDLKVNCIVFRPKRDQIYNCLVTTVDKKYITAKLYDTVTFFASLKHARKSPEIGEKVSIKFSRLEIKGTLCQMKGAIV